MGALTTGERMKAILGGAAGNFVEWFDWFVFVSFGIYFSKNFFPHAEPTVQLMQSAAVLAMGFVIRPFGSLVFGLYADRCGRRSALSVSVGMMCAGSCLIALAPGYETIGPAAPALLLLARLLQGFSVGGEYGTSAAYISEMAGADRRGFWSSFQCVTLVAGQLFALLLLVTMQHVMSRESLTAWGWRIPFLVGAALAIIVYWIRRHLSESESFAQEGEALRSHASVRHLLTDHFRPTAMVFLLTAAGSTGFYVFVGYLQKFMVNSGHLTPSSATAVMAAALVIFLIVQPLCGLLSDRLGRRYVLIASFGATALTCWPVMHALTITTNPAGALVLALVSLLLFSGYTAIGAVVKAELYPAHVRALGVGFPYALANAAFGGTAEFLALWSKQRDQEPIFFGYLTLLMLAGMTVAIWMPDTKAASKIE